MRGKFAQSLTGLLIVVSCMAAGGLLAGAANPPADRTFHIVCRKYAYDPPIIHVNRGDRITIYLASTDVTHGFYIDGYNIDASISPDEKPKLKHPAWGDKPKEVENIQFVANKEGKFRYRCSQSCGVMHPFMIGEMVVAPNRPFYAGLGGAVGVMLAGLFAAFRKGGVKNGQVNS